MAGGKPKGKRVPRERLPRERIEDNTAPAENGSGIRIKKRWPGPGPGRPLGSKNATPKQIQDSLVAAARKHGEDGKGAGELEGFWLYAIRTEPRAVLGIFARMIPQHVRTSVDPQSALGQILEAARARLQYEKSRMITSTVIKP